MQSCRWIYSLICGAFFDSLRILEKGTVFLLEDDRMAETRVAVISVIVENVESVEAINALLHQYRQYIIGRMGVPYPKKNISIISVAMDGPMDAVSALSGKLGALTGVSTKTVYSKK